MDCIQESFLYNLLVINREDDGKIPIFLAFFCFCIACPEVLVYKVEVERISELSSNNCFIILILIYLYFNHAQRSGVVPDCADSFMIHEMTHFLFQEPCCPVVGIGTEKFQ